MELGTWNLEQNKIDRTYRKKNNDLEQKQNKIDETWKKIQKND